MGGLHRHFRQPEGLSSPNPEPETLSPWGPKALHSNLGPKALHSNLEPKAPHPNLGPKAPHPNRFKIKIDTISP